MRRSTNANETGGRREANGTADGKVRATLTLFVCLLPILLAPGCGKKAVEEGAAADVPTITADVGQVTRQDLTARLTVRGTIAAAPNDDVRISALVGGRVDSVPVAEGDTVKAGQVVATIDPRPLQDQRRQAAAALSQAKAAVENSKANLDRTQHLFERGIAARKEVEDARAQQAAAEAGVETAEAALDNATRQLGRAQVMTPIAGSVIKRLVSVGEQVDGTAAQPILQVANLDRVELAANVPAEQLGAVHVGQRVDVVSDAYPDTVFPGEVVAVAPAIDAATNAALARVRVANADHRLKVGMFAEARIAVFDRKGALTVPPSAIALSESGEPAVYVVTNGVAQRTPVKVGLKTPAAVEIQEGVAEGQSVLTSAVHGLGDKAKVGKTS